jgi:release factor glutamine methyltransferase
LKTRRELLSEAAAFLEKKYKHDSRLSAEILLAHVLGVDRTALLRDDDRTVSPEEGNRYGALVERRYNGEPVAYLTGEKEFFSLSFMVDPSVLIPRPETEALVEAAIERLREKASGRVIDVGTGSGAVAITLKKHLPNLEVFGSDVSEASLEVASKNSARHAADVRWMQSDLLKNVEGTFDAILANLPYIPAKDIPHLTVGVRDYEPHQALDGGGDGLDLLRRFISETAERLNRGGWLFLEVGNAQEEDVRKLLQTAGYSIESIVNDLAGIPRVVIARRG